MKRFDFFICYGVVLGVVFFLFKTNMLNWIEALIGLAISALIIVIALLTDKNKE